MIAATHPLTHRRVWALAWPMILSNSSVPLLGLVDTAIIGQMGTPATLGAIALGATLFTGLYWSFGFLRMGTTGLVAQAMGAQNNEEIKSTLGRATLIGLTLGIIFVVLQSPIGLGALLLVEGSDTVEGLTLAYFRIRIWGAPATLVTFCFVGWFIGLQKTRWALALQLWLNGLNIILDLIFVLGFGWGVEGIALGTLIAEISTALLGLFLVRLYFKQRGISLAFQLDQLINPAALKRNLVINVDILLRTLGLLTAFTWFTLQGAKAGDTILAANYVLLQFVTFGGFFLDGFAFAAEALVGNAVGARSATRLSQAVRLSTHLAVFAACLFSLIYFLFGQEIIALLVTAQDVRHAAETFLPWAVAIPILSVWCYQLDGIFIGATRSADLRNMMLLSLAVYLLAWSVLAPHYGNHGLWAAFALFFVVRGLTLSLRYGALLRDVNR